MERLLSKYLSVLTLIPVVALILLIFLNLTRAYTSLSEAKNTIHNTQFVSTASYLVHELQKERGMTAGFIGSKGTKFLSKIKSQRKLTDQRLQDLIESLNHYKLDNESESKIKRLQSNLQKIDFIRNRVDNLDIDLNEALSYYTDNNIIVLDLYAHLASLLKNNVTSKKFLTLYNIANIKEQAGIERAVLSNVFASNTLSRALYSKYIKLLSNQEAYFKFAYTLASSEFRNTLDDFTQSKENKQVQSFRDALDEQQNDFNLEASEWFDVATKRIDILKQTEEILLDEIEAHAEYEESIKLFRIIAEIILLILMSLIAFAVYKTIQLRSSQSLEINRFMKAVDSEKDLTDSVNVITNDELGRIGELINVTFANIRKDFISFQNNAHQIGEATIQASSATKQSKSNLTQLQVDISSIVSATEQMSASVRSVMESMKVAASEAQHAAQETIMGEQAVEVSTTSILNTADEVERVGETITELNTRVEDILGMVDVIKSVADQTNLLALNAAIEAARAGEQGRGFAVVADEVRTLAMRTQRSTQDISGVVDILNQSSQNAFNTIEIGNQRAKSAVNNAHDISAVLKNIIQNIKSVDDATRTIATSTQEQSTVIQSINSSIINIDEQARKNVVGAEQLLVASYRLSNIAQEMEDRIKHYKV
jgi:methyl-accepting chemotaxis protein